MEESRDCGKCHRTKALTAENWKAQFRGGGLHIASNCRVCSEKDRLRKQEKRNGKDPEKENALTGVSKDDPDDASEFLGVDPISLDTFRGALRAAGEINVLCARIDISTLPNAGTDGLKAATDVLAEIVWETIGYRFLYVAVFWTVISCNNHFL
jgi:hypothetical protein